MHELPTLVGQRSCGIALGYEDLSDHDQLRHDPILALLSDRLEAKRKDCAVLSGKSTLNRLEHAPSGAPDRYRRIGHDREAMERLFVDLYLDAHAAAPARIMLDLDATDDPVHGTQEGRFYHGYYKSYCYLPLYITCGRHLLAAKLRPANIDGAAGAREEVARIVAQIRERWPRVEIVLRADSGFARDNMMAWCEANDVDYVFGLAQNARLRKWIAGEAAVAKAAHARTGRAQRRFADFRYSTRKSWSRARRVVGKAEHLEKGANPRFVVTSLPPELVKARWLYEQLYCAPGRDGEPDQGVPARPVRRPHLGGDDAGQPAAALVCFAGLSPGRQPASHRTSRHAARQSDGGLDPPQAVEDWCPGDRLGASHQGRHGLGASLET